MPQSVERILSSLQTPTRAGRLSIGKRQLCLAAATIAVLLISGFLAARLPERTVTVVPGFSAIFQTAMLSINLILAVLLFIIGEIEECGNSIRLGTAYLYIALMTIPQIASSEGMGPSAGAIENPIWIWFLWHIGFGFGILRYAWFASRSSPLASSWRQSAKGVAVLVLLVTWISLSSSDELPALWTEGHFSLSGAGLLVWVPVGIVMLAALFSVVCLGATTPERVWLIVAMAASCLQVWFDVQNAARFTPGWYVAKEAGVVASLAVLLSQLGRIARLYREAVASKAALQKVIRLDILTGLFNRRGFDEKLNEEFRRARRQQLSLALLLLDVDFFEIYNDRYGHQGGDDCLRRIAAAIKGALWRPGDYAARYDGKTIAILLPATDLRGAVVIAERVRAAVAALAVPHVGSPLNIVTVSAGAGSILPLDAGDGVTDLIRTANRALDQAKTEGRDRVCAGTASIVAKAKRLSPAL